MIARKLTRKVKLESVYRIGYSRGLEVCTVGVGLSDSVIWIVKIRTELVLLIRLVCQERNGLWDPCGEVGNVDGAGEEESWSNVEVFQIIRLAMDENCSIATKCSLKSCQWHRICRRTNIGSVTDIIVECTVHVRRDV